jgi:hypothetical protein
MNRYTQMFAFFAVLLRLRLRLTPEIAVIPALCS